MKKSIILIVFVIFQFTGFTVAQIKIHQSGGISIGSTDDPGSNIVKFHNSTTFYQPVGVHANVSFNSYISSDLIPIPTMQNDLGSSSWPWEKIYVKDISVSNGFPNVLPTTTGNDLGSGILRWDLFASNINTIGYANINGTTLTGSSYNFKISPYSGGYLMVCPSPGQDMSFITDKDFYVFDEEIYVPDVIEYSDTSLKENIILIADKGSSIEKLILLEGIQYNLKDDKDKTVKVGFAAQEVQLVIPEVVHLDHEGNLGVSYTSLVPFLVEAIKEQNEKIENLERQITILSKSAVLTGEISTTQSE